MISFSFWGRDYSFSFFTLFNKKKSFKFHFYQVFFHACFFVFCFSSFSFSLFCNNIGYNKRKRGSKGFGPFLDIAQAYLLNKYTLSYYLLKLTLNKGMLLLINAIMSTGFLQWSSRRADWPPRNTHQYSMSRACTVTDSPEFIHRGTGKGMFNFLFKIVLEFIRSFGDEVALYVTTVLKTNTWFILYFIYHYIISNGLVWAHNPLSCFLYTLSSLLKSLPTACDQRHKMPTSRCVRLILVGIANGSKEMWIAQQPFLLVYYVWQYTPTWAWFITNVLGRKRVQNFKSGLVRYILLFLHVSAHNGFRSTD